MGMDEEYDIAELKAAASSGDSERITEALARVELMFAAEDREWLKISGGYHPDKEGLDLAKLKEISKQIREYLAGSPLIKRAVSLRTSYVFSKGVNIPGFEYAPTAGTKHTGRPSKVRRFFSDSVNAKYFTSSSAQEQLERTAATDGVVLMLGQTTSAGKQLRQIPISDITEVAVHPEFPSEVIAYQRSWTMYKSSTEPVPMSRWYYTDSYTGPKAKEIEGVEVDQSSVIFDQMFNTQAGWTFGIPDALSAVAWSKIYTELVNYGKAMTETLARFAMYLKHDKSSTGAAAGLQMAKSNAAGQVASIGSGMDFAALSTAGKTYDFDGLRPVAAMVATAMEVSVIHLLSDPGAAGSSYGSAQNLDVPTKRAIVSRQSTWASYFERILKWVDPKAADTNVTFPPLDDPDPYREMQVVVLGHSTGLIHPDEARARVMSVGQFEDKHGDQVPDTYQSPTDAGETTTTNDTASANAGVNQGTPDQGRSNGGGGVDKSLNNDLL